MAAKQSSLELSNTLSMTCSATLSNAVTAGTPRFLRSRKLSRAWLRPWTIPLSNAGITATGMNLKLLNLKFCKKKCKVTIEWNLRSPTGLLLFLLQYWELNERLRLAKTFYRMDQHFTLSEFPANISKPCPENFPLINWKNLSEKKVKNFLRIILGFLRKLLYLLRN